MNFVTTLISVAVWIVSVSVIIYTIYRLVKSDLTKKQKIFWIIFIFLFGYGVIGCAVFWIFYVIRKARKQYEADKKEKTHISTYSATREYETVPEEEETTYKSEYEVPVAATESDDAENANDNSENSGGGKIPV